MNTPANSAQFASKTPPIEKILHAENEELGSDGIKGSSLSGRFVFPMQ
jgi:hypothetical protein